MTHLADAGQRVSFGTAFVSLGDVILNRRLRPLYWLNFLFYLAIFGFFRSYPMYLVDEYHLGVSRISEFIAWVGVSGSGRRRGRRPQHHRGYDVMFSKEFLERTGFALNDYAYYFERHYEVSSELTRLHWELAYSIDEWKRQHHLRDVFLTWEWATESASENSRLMIRDSRCGEVRQYSLHEFHSRVYLACDGAPRTIPWLAGELLQPGDGSEALEDALSFLDREKLIWREGEQVLGLATPAAVAQNHQENRWIKTWTALSQ